MPTTLHAATPALGGRATGGLTLRAPSTRAGARWLMAPFSPKPDPILTMAPALTPSPNQVHDG